MVKLGVNIDHVASVRNIRFGIEPEPLLASLICEAAGADSIVIHLREDRRHINEKDLYIIKSIVKKRLNLEMSTFNDIVEIACDIKPDQATLVPEKRQEVTTEGGLDVIGGFKKVKKTVSRLRHEDINVSLFIDPLKTQIDAAAEAGVDRIELHTGRYANVKKIIDKEGCLKELKAAVVYAKSKGLHVYAGHGLDYYNVRPIAGIKGIEELNIGYAIVCRAVLVGLERAVKEMKYLMNNAIV